MPDTTDDVVFEKMDKIGERSLEAFEWGSKITAFKVLDHVRQGGKDDGDVTVGTLLTLLVNMEKTGEKIEEPNELLSKEDKTPAEQVQAIEYLQDIRSRVLAVGGCALATIIILDQLVAMKREMLQEQTEKEAHDNG